MEKSLQKVDIRYEGKDDQPERRSIRPKMENNYSGRLQEVAANEHKIDDRATGGDAKGPAPGDPAPRSRRGPRSPPPPAARKRKSRARGAAGGAAAAGKGIDSDPFMRCFLREVDTNAGTTATEAEAERQVDGGVLYLYPLVEYRPADSGPEGDDDEGGLTPKVEAFYEDSGGSGDGSGDGFPEPKVFLYSPSDDPLAAGEGVCRCVVCDDTFADRSGLQRHMLWSHVDEDENRCEACGRRFETVFKARSHVLVEHVGVDCRLCRRRFPDGNALRSHMSVTRRLGGCVSTPNASPPTPLPCPPDTGPKMCEVCLEGFATPPELASHVESEHASLLEHRCDLCSRTFLDEDELFAHVDRDPHVCLLCSAYFESTLGLRHHLLCHATDSRVLELFTANNAETPDS